MKLIAVKFADGTMTHGSVESVGLTQIAVSINGTVRFFSKKTGREFQHGVIRGCDSMGRIIVKNAL